MDLGVLAHRAVEEAIEGLVRFGLAARRGFLHLLLEAEGVE